MTEKTIFAKVEPNRAAEEVARRIEARVLEGILRNGDRLPAERDLAQQMDVSRPVLREAIKSLETRGVLETRHGQGTVVANVIGSIFAPAIESLVRQNSRVVADFVEFRRDVDGMAAGLAAERATDDDLELLRDVFERMVKADERKNVEEEGALDLEFHMTIADCAHNVILIHTLRSCYKLLSDNVFLNRGLIYSFPGARADLLNQHRTIYEAIVAREPVAARRAAEAHMDYIASTMASVERVGRWRENAALRRAQRQTGKGSAAK